MSSAQYVELVVLPTVREFLAKRDDRRLAYLSAISTYHVIDYLMRSALPTDPAARRAELVRVAGVIEAACPNAYAVVEGMCNGTKHCGRDRHGATPFTPGTEKVVPAFVLDRDGGGLDQGRLDKPGLTVTIAPGSTHWVDDALRQFLVAAVDAFTAELGSVSVDDLRR